MIHPHKIHLKKRQRLFVEGAVFQPNKRHSVRGNADGLAIMARKLRAQGQFDRYRFIDDRGDAIEFKVACPSFEGACEVMVLISLRNGISVMFQRSDNALEIKFLQP